MTRRLLSICILCTIAACGTDHHYDVVLIGGRVIDPETGMDSVLNVGITDSTIEMLGVEPISGAIEIDATGLVVSPGFIDLHAHGQRPQDMILQAQDGVTSALELEIGVYPVDEWYATLDGRAPINYGASVSHIGVRLSVFHPETPVLHWPTQPDIVAGLGSEPAGTNASASPAQVEQIVGGVTTGMADGGLGVGFGINYTPGASREEIASLFAAAAQREAPVFVHTRAFGLDAIDEAIEIAEDTRASLHIVHLGSSALQYMDQALEHIAAARERGMDVTTEVYPYTAASTRLESAMFNPGWQENLPIDYGDIEWVETGERLTAETFDEHRAEGGWVILYMMEDENIDRAVAADGVIIASDGVPFENGRGHPRGAGTFARVLGRYVRDRGVLSLTDALAKMTILPARRVQGVAPGMARRGRIAVQAVADVTVFDPATVIDRATFADPMQPSAGIEYVIVGGTFVVRDGELVVGATPGRPIRNE